MKYSLAKQKAFLQMNMWKKHLQTEATWDLPWITYSF